MDTERPHRTARGNSSTSELFVCFTSRLSSSSMKLSSKSLLSPGRSREPPQISLSTSLSRRLRNNGSMKGGQASPMFPAVGGKRRGCGFENPEPSSPKVTCIGQVRVKTKKQGKKMRSRSKRRGEASFRRTEQQQHGFQLVGAASSDLTGQNSQGFQYQNHQNLQQECLKHRNQRWVHLPLTICEALREFSCFFPCRSSCMSKEEKGCAEAEGSSGARDKEGSCGAAFGRWLVALQEGDGKGRGIELVMGEEHDGNGKGNNTERNCSQRRHVFEDIDIDVGEGKNKKDEEFGGEEEEKARVSICIPPKNALLLMRCRSDPVKMAALANRFWESPVEKDRQEVDEEDEDNEYEEVEEAEAEAEGGEEEHIEMEEGEEKEEERNSICEREREAGFVSSEEDHVVIQLETAEEAELEVKESCANEGRVANPERSEVHEPNQAKEVEEEKDESEGGNVIHQDETFSSVCSTLEDAQADLEKLESEEAHPSLNNQKEEHENEESSELSSSPSTFIASGPQNEAELAMTTSMAEASAEGSIEEEKAEEKGIPEAPPEKKGEQEIDPTHEGSGPVKDPERVNGSKTEERGTERETLPECLLLMMCEPKLSMEVSKETWVCSTDFVRWMPPERRAGKTDAASGVGVGLGKRVCVGSKPKKPSPQPLMQPPRSSCSFPAAPAVGLAGMIEQKLVGSKSNNGYEPFVLTRCKSEPMRSSAKLAPEVCFWKNRKLEQAAPVGVGAPAGVGC